MIFILLSIVMTVLFPFVKYGVFTVSIVSFLITFLMTNSIEKTHELKIAGLKKLQSNDILFTYKEIRSENLRNFQDDFCYLMINSAIFLVFVFVIEEPKLYSYLFIFLFNALTLCQISIFLSTIHSFIASKIILSRIAQNR